MKLDSVRELKSTLPDLIRARFAEPAIARAAGLAVARAASAESVLPSYALGVTHNKAKGFRLALRLQSRALEKSELVDFFSARAKGEIDIRYIGRVTAGAKRARTHAAGFRNKQRPLMIGYSCGFQTPGFVMAGTLGCFVRKGKAGRVMILSNNHVLADENALPLNSPIYQPGLLDSGRGSTDRVATLTKFLRLQRSPKKNLIDCAVATLDPGITYDPVFITGVGNLAGVAPALPDINDRVHKAGRTTGTTHGRVTAFEVDGVTVGYDFGTATFDNQIEIEGEGASAFSQAGDSGSVIVDDSLHATALLFAGSDHGGSNNAGLTYANPFNTVLKKLGVKLVLT